MKKNIDLKFHIILAFCFFIILFSLYSVWEFYKIDVKTASAKESVLDVEKNLIDVEQRLLQKELKRVISDVFIVKNIVENGINNSDYHLIEDFFVNIIESKKIYDQIRYINEEGEEVVRVDVEDGKVIVIRDEQLQNKHDRYYFEDTMKIEENEVYISKFDLNMENGKIESPKKPMIRLSCRVYDKNGNPRGIVINNYYAEELIDDFITISDNKYGDVHLLNQKGYYLSSTSEEISTFSFMYAEKKGQGFFKDYSKVWHSIIKHQENQIVTDNNIFFARSIIPLKDEKDTRLSIPIENIVLGEGNLWVVVQLNKTKFPQAFDKNIGEKFEYIFRNNALNIFFIVLLSLALSYIYQKIHVVRIKNKFQSERDQITSALNRRAGLKKAEQLIKRNRGSGIDICVIFMDVNGLKSVNDLLGHKFGDQLIVAFSSVINKAIREDDIFIRYGGDEFILCQEKMTMEQAEIFWQRILVAIKDINNSDQYPFNISVSHGVSIIKSEIKNIDINAYIEEADENMYIEKKEIKKNVTIIKAKDK